MSPAPDDAAGFIVSSVVPILRMYDVAASIRFYVDYLGCTLDWQDGDGDRPVYLQVSRGALVLQLSSHHDDGTPGTAVLVTLRDVEALHAESTHARLPVPQPRCRAGAGGRQGDAAHRSGFQPPALLRAGFGRTRVVHTADCTRKTSPSSARLLAASPAGSRRRRFAAISNISCASMVSRCPRHTRPFSGSATSGESARPAASASGRRREDNVLFPRAEPADLQGKQAW
jgi:ribosomal-protein-alanine N-acetyltransferase